MGNPMMGMALQCSPIWFCPYPAIIHVAVADMDAVDAAHAAAENNAFNKIDNRNQYAKNNHRAANKFQSM